MKHALRAALVASLLVVAQPVAAQDFSSIGSQYVDYGASMMAVGQMNNVLGGTARNSARPAKAKPATGPDTRYAASPAVSTRVRAQFADFAAKADPANGPRLREAILRQDLLGAWQKHVAVDGLKRGDVADAMAAYWVQNWQMASQIAFVDRAKVQAVRNQVARALIANPAFTRLDDARKQEMAETFMLNFVAQGSAYSDATTRRDTAQVARLSKAAAARIRQEMSLDAAQLRLTPAGFAR
ncbi:DUF6683 family protein [Caulobacter sp.]|uniref:DUF6683 family protein n=1 Tax=Caulobacter sp. TaxID=78 RepID=UPI0031DD89BA